MSSKTAEDALAISCFSLPLAPWQQPRSHRTLACEKRKRKSHDIEQDEGHDNDNDNGYDGSNNANTHYSESEHYRTVSEDHLLHGRYGNSNGISGGAYSSRASSAQTLTPDEQRQYLVSGLDLDSELPGDHFPHRAPVAAGPQSYKSAVKIQRELSNLAEPVFDPFPAGRRTLRLQHLAVVTAILHRCLIAGDYIRAGRAWGLILRDSFAGTPVQVKYTARWGVGAEILLWSDFDCESISIDSSKEKYDNGNHRVDRPVRQQRSVYRQWYTRNGFRKAKDYYDRLILQYPYTKSHPHALSPLDFYPAMLGLWISIAQEESRAARESVVGGGEGDEEDDDGGENNDGNTYTGDNMMETAFDSGEVLPPSHYSSRQRSRVISARANELVEAERIAAELDRILQSPPYSDSPRLLELRGMVSQWIGDLHVSSVTADDPDNMPLDDVQLSLDYRVALERREREIQKANEIFEKARRRDKKADSHVTYASS
ncbi:hypothetical protein KEM54_002214 [Ascosphaera aggregata]|nr:hypothetical protein KEM54_002214 [Ascosphaera aggregata]